MRPLSVTVAVICWPACIGRGEMRSSVIPAIATRTAKPCGRGKEVEGCKAAGSGRLFAGSVVPVLEVAAGGRFEVSEGMGVETGGAVFVVLAGVFVGVVIRGALGRIAVSCGDDKITPGSGVFKGSVATLGNELVLMLRINVGKFVLV